MIAYDEKSWISVALRVRGSVIPRILPRIVLVAAIGVGAQYLNVTASAKVPPVLHTMLGVALGLLLVFRTTASYDRWWEGRKLLGGLVNRTRDLARQASAYLADESERSDVQRYTSAYFVLACQGLRRENDMGALGELLTGDERTTLEGARHRANVVSAWMTGILAGAAQGGRLSEQRLQLMDGNLSLFNDYVGGCERIAKTPLPLAYAQHTKLLVTLFCLTAPFALSDSLGWLTPVGACVLAFALFGVDEIGVEIEDPFGHDPNDLPLEAVAATIEGDTRELVRCPARPVRAPSDIRPLA